MKSINLLLLMAIPLLAIFVSCVPRQYPVTSTYEETAYRTEYISETYTENETTSETLSGQYDLVPFYSWYSQYVAFSGNDNFWYTAYDVPEYPPYDSLRLRIFVWKQLQSEPATISVFDMTKGGHLSAPAPAIPGDSGEGQVEWKWITGTGEGTELSSSSNTESDSDSSTDSGQTVTIGGVSDSWLDAANIQINQALFLGGRTCLWSKEENPQIFELNAGRAKRIGVILCGPEYRWNTRVTVSATWSQNIITYRPVTRERKVEKQVPYKVQKQKTVYETRQAPFWEGPPSP